MMGIVIMLGMLGVVSMTILGSGAYYICEMYDDNEEETTSVK